MLWIVFVNLIILMEFSTICYSFRRVRDGKDVTKDKTYAVYLVKAEPSQKQYDEWLCGGAIVNKWFIVTSAACVEDVKHMYAIAGYKKMVLFDKLNEDECTKVMKKRVVLTCVPKSYEFDYANIEKWATIDIAAVKVESEYDFNDAKYETLCSYKPTPIDINYENKYQEPGNDVLIMGWGHETKWRDPKDTNIYNVASLKVASALIATKKVCKDKYDNFDSLIDKYMICVNGNGNLDDKGDVIEKVTPVFTDGCITKEQKLKGIPGKQCELNEEQEDEYDMKTIKTAPDVEYGDALVDEVSTMSKGKVRNKTIKFAPEDEQYADALEEEIILKIRKTRNFKTLKAEDENQKEYELKNRRKMKRDTVHLEETRRTAGICQNDHGSPIVTWRGSQEILIGVASVFRVFANGECTGPYLFTSTQCNGIFLDCVISELTNETRRSDSSNICQISPKIRGFDIIRRVISWKDHPHGRGESGKPIYHENIYHVAMRPQIPITYYG